MHVHMHALRYTSHNCGIKNDFILDEMLIYFVPLSSYTVALEAVTLNLYSVSLPPNDRFTLHFQEVEVIS